MDERYKAIINLPRHVSPSRKKMDVQDRAAQFAPYAALVGFGDVVDEAARITVERAVQDEGEIERINRILTYVLASVGEIKAEFTYFKKDARKSGGDYLKKEGYAVKIDESRHELVFLDKTILPIDDIVKIELI